jgi:mono/diheme cytochrome c family protein
MSSRNCVRWLVAAVLLSGLVTFVASCQKRAEESATTAVTSTLDSASMATIDPGQEAYLQYCAMCHGQWGGGDGPVAAQLTQEAKAHPAALNDRERMSRLSRDEVIRVIERGGAHTGRSNLMPPWADKIDRGTIERIADFVNMLPDLKAETPPATIQAYMQSPPGSAPEGRTYYVFYCAMCHGPKGGGNGPTADTLFARNRIRPRDLTDSTYFAGKSDQELFSTVSLGGGHFHKSGYMPRWSVTLRPEQIKSLVSYIRAISHTPSQP